MTPDRSLIVVEDDAGFARTLKRSFERRGYEAREPGIGIHAPGVRIGVGGGRY